MPTKQEMEDQTLEFLDCLDSRLETLEICLDVWLESITLLESLNKMSQLKLGVLLKLTNFWWLFLHSTNFEF